MKRNRDQQECIRCHSEHNGEGFVPIRWDVDLEDFDHGKTGYGLDGAHRGLACKRCHTPAHIGQSERRQITVKDLRRTYLGLSRECLSCHADEHRGQLSTDCRRCHTFSQWKPASKFDHAEAKFQLAGAHERVACGKCHLKTGEPEPHTRFVGLPFSGCTPCHSDPHHGALAASCQECHSAAAWKPAHVSSQFDHSRTAFPLLGKHAGVACTRCHHTSNFKEPAAHGRCLDCHAANFHQGQFATRADGGECSSCHVVEGWKPSIFSIESHRATRYALKGRHAGVACEKCHIPAGQATQYRIKFEQCTNCHSDTHKAQFAGPPHYDRCGDCHTVEGFRPSTFSLARHDETRFLLSGAHAAIPCGECHQEPLARHPSPGRYRFSDRSCAGCHEDPHQGQFAQRMQPARSDGSRAGCEACHNLRTWQDLSRFDHATTSFPLAGAHRVVDCEQCHRPSSLRLRMRGLVFSSAPKQCSGCHEDIHGGQFSARSSGTDCARCHNTLKWRPSLFDHNTESSFALTGAHQRTACGLCHKKNREIDGKLVLLFKPTPQECTDCHGPEITN